ncbi:MAG: hypothetical protein PF638_02235 [Candidatus Delongbacteria bacterium]|jgi:putative transposase|nr:hypothetical protein [Candidatus Delongbacteria bacterium]
MFKRSDERKLTRLKGYDYSQNGYYFVTICVEDMEHPFGFIENEHMNLSEFGKIAQQCLNDLPKNYDNCFLDETIIMPNHIHYITIISNHTVGDDFLSSPVTINSMNGFVLKKRDGKKPSPTNAYGITLPDMNLKTNANKIHDLSEMVRSFKHYVTRNINKLNPNRKFKWQKSFYDHIIRNDNDLNRIRKYIINNPINWEKHK